MPAPVPARPIEQRSYRGWFAALAALVAATTAWAIWDETRTRRPWKAVQRDFNRLLRARGEPTRALAIVQVTNPELGVVDRCQTCHLGIDRPGFAGENVAPVFRTHPRREVLLGPGHRVDEIGCTLCHQGQGRQTKGVRGAAFDHGRDDPYWERPLLGPGYTESTCVTCHADDDPIPGAPAYERGRRLFEDLRCFGCHRSPAVTPDFAIAPPFDHLRGKSAPAWVSRWLADPAAVRPGTRMPRFWPAPIDSRDGSPAGGATRAAWQAERDREIAALVAFLAQLPARQPLPDPPAADPTAAAADPAAAARLFDQIGCRGCNSAEDPPAEPRVADEPVGPDLAGIGAIASARWLAAWLADPRGVWSAASMPDLRLDPAQRAALVGHLVALRADGDPPAAPAWPAGGDPAAVDAGRAAIERYGCYGCHDIPGFERAGRAGIDLDGFGDKTPAMLAWGDAAADCGRPALECWTERKIASPRRFAGRGLVAVMPQVDLVEADARALAIFALSHRARTVPAAYRRVRGEPERARERGERTLARRGCRGCHEIGRVARPIVEDGEVVDTEYFPIGGKLLAYYDTPAEGPPPLTLAGEKFHYPWLHEFLAAPGRVRPWLVARMPSFRLDAAQRTALIHGFAVQAGQPYPFVDDPRPTLPEADRAAADQLFALLQCTKCHQVSTAADLPVGDRAPDLALTRDRLRNDWQRRWILEPQRLQPGTAMPTYFPLADPDDPRSYTTPCPACFDGDIARQVDALVALTNAF